MKCRRENCHRAGIYRRRGLCNPHYKLSDRGYVDPTAAREHLLRLFDSGHSWTEIAELAGMTRGGVDRIRDGSYPKMRKATAVRILAIPMRFGTSGTIDATGTVRRLRALMASGWPVSVLAEQMGIPASTLGNHLDRRTVSVVRARQIAELFSRLQMVPGPSKRMRTIGRKKGWALPFAWDEDDIDDPSATPDSGGKSTWIQKYEDYRSTGLSDAEVAAAMGIQLESLKRQLERKAA